LSDGDSPESSHISPYLLQLRRKHSVRIDSSLSLTSKDSTDECTNEENKGRYYYCVVSGIDMVCAPYLVA
jgi:hypothetical protein